MADRLEPPWPQDGRTSIEVEGVGSLGGKGGQGPVPIASVTKVMTAYSILKKHPLKDGEKGPEITGGDMDMGAPWAGAAQGPPVGGASRVPRLLSASACSSCPCARRSMPSLSCSSSSLSVAVGRAGGELSSVRRS